VAGEFSYDDPGAIFLTALNGALASGPKGLRLSTQKPNDPLPLDRLQDHIAVEVQRQVSFLFKEKQTVRLTGTEPAGVDATYDPNEPSPPKIALDWKPAQNFTPARKELIDNILKEAALVPPVKVQSANEPNLSADAFPLFSQAAMKGYQR